MARGRLKCPSVSAGVTVQARDRRAEFLRGVARADGIAAVFAESSTRLRRLVPFDAAAWVGNDPVTGLPTAPVRVDGLGELSREGCSEHWRREFLVPDVNLFRDLARAGSPAAGLHASAGDPHRSPRYRSFLRPLGFEDELRAVLRVGSAPWGSITLWRRHGQGSFTRREIALVASLSAPIGAAVRLHARHGPQRNGPVRRDPARLPGLRPRRRRRFGERPGRGMAGRTSSRAGAGHQSRGRGTGMDGHHRSPGRRRAPWPGRRHGEGSCPKPPRPMAGVPRLLPR